MPKKRFDFMRTLMMSFQPQ